jgi:hypothetical protein
MENYKRDKNGRATARPGPSGKVGGPGWTCGSHIARVDASRRHAVGGSRRQVAAGPTSRESSPGEQTPASLSFRSL